MADIKYYIRYFDVDGSEHRVNIYKPNYGFLESTQIDGYCTLKAGAVDNVDELFRGQGLTLNLQADTSQTFSEFFTSNERTYKVEYKIDGQIVFVGWIEPEGYYESFVADKWFIQVNCLDGLSYLNNLSYVQSNGLIWTGKQTALQIILNCLERTNLYLDVFTDIDIVYTGLSESLDVLDNIYFNSERFYKDDGDTIMSCEDVLKDMLQIFGASIIQYHGRWIIYKINQYFDSQIPNVFRYSYSGLPKGGATLFNIDKTIGSESQGAELFHCNENQSIGLEKATAIARIYYKYGLLRTLNVNYELDNNGSTIPEWTIKKPSSIRLFGTSVEVYTTLSSPSIVFEHTDGIELSQNQSLSASFSVQSLDIDIGTVGSSLFRYAVSYIPNDNPTQTLWQTSDGWGEDMEVLGTWVNNSGWQTVDFESSAILSDGVVYVHILESYEGAVLIDSIRLTLGDKNTDQPNGEVWTFENEDITSSKAKENIEIFNGDNNDEFYIGTIYENDQVTKTTTWRRKGNAEDLPIIHLLGQDLMRLRQGNSIIFNGDVKGFIDYWSIISIDGFDGLYSIIEYNYSSREDITSLKLKRFYNTEITNLDIGDSPVLDYGNTVKPTIRG